MADLQISSLSRIVYSLMISNGIAGIKKNSSEFEIKKGWYSDISKALKPLGLDIIEEDMSFYFTSIENWEIIIDLLYGKIISFFKWEADKFDCDNRSALFSALASVIFGINTSGQVFCEVQTPKGKYMHKANIIIDKDNVAYLFDIDNGGLKQKITGKKMVMGNATYNLISLRIY